MNSGVFEEETPIRKEFGVDLFVEGGIC